jgi:predicted RNA binding protein YcfA (HicA-like mRNA interferase family)
MSLSDLPLACGADHAKVFCKSFGWAIRREGNHITLTHPENSNCLSIPNHKEVKRALLHKLIKLAGKTDEEYREAFDSVI